jgi:copper resistance protein B
MKTWVVVALTCLPPSTSAWAQAPAPDPHAGHDMAGPAVDPHASHNMSAPPDPIAAEPAPAPPSNYAADRFYSREAMAAARTALAKDHGGGTYWKVSADTLEHRFGEDGDSYAFDGEFRYGGDINRFVGKAEVDGAIAGDVHKAEVQALYARAISPYFDLHAGIRHDFEPRPQRTYAVVGMEGLAPYGFDVGGAVFLSGQGELSVRLEGAYDLRLTQKLILSPRVEVNLAAEDAAELGVGQGFTDAEVGLRLHYAFKPEFGPYVGVNHQTALSETADRAREAGEAVNETTLVVGLRAWM